MTDPLRAKIEQLKIMKESASRRSSLYSDMGTLDDKKTSQSLGALNRASVLAKKCKNWDLSCYGFQNPQALLLLLAHL